MAVACLQERHDRLGMMICCDAQAVLRDMITRKSSARESMPVGCH